MNARRTLAAGTSAAVATASSTTPSSAPCRSSPESRRTRNCCSSAVAAVSKAESRPSRRAADPAPDVPARSVSAWSTAATVSDGSLAGSPAIRARVRQPTPSRPCRVSPESHAVTGSTSAASACRSSSAIVPAFAVRDLVAATAVDAATTSASSIAPSSQSSRRLRCEHSAWPT